MNVMKCLVFLGAMSVPAAAQLTLPSIGPGIGDVVRGLPVQVDRLGDTAAAALGSASALAQQRLVRLDTLVRRNPSTIERDDRGEPARRGELIMVDADLQSLDVAQAAGFLMLDKSTIEGTGVNFARLSVPNGMSLAKAERDLKRRLPSISISADHIHFKSSAEAGEQRSQPAPASAAPSGGYCQGKLPPLISNC